MDSAPIHWTTPGFKIEEGEAIRGGIARVRVHGQATILKSSRKELPWGVYMSTPSVIRVVGYEDGGPVQIGIGPQNFSGTIAGSPDTDGVAAMDMPCEHCTFTADEAFQSTLFKAHFVCRYVYKDGRGYERYYRLTAPGKTDMMGMYMYWVSSMGAISRYTGITLSLAGNWKRDPDCSV
jgi:hypothetical protein